MKRGSRRSRDERPDGLPEVPAEWSRYLLPKPVMGKIIEVLSDEVAVLSVGATDGLRSGMLLVRESDRASEPITVLFTEPDRCVISIDLPERKRFPVSSESAASAGMSEPKPFAVGESISSQTPNAWNDR